MGTENLKRLGELVVGLGEQSVVFVVDQIVAQTGYLEQLKQQLRTNHA